MKHHAILVKLLVLLLVGASCSQKGLNTYRNFANSFDVSRKPTKPYIVVVSSSPDSVRVYVKFLRRALVFSSSPGNPQQAWVRTSLSLLPTMESKTALDSLILEIGPKIRTELSDTLVLQGKLYAPAGGSYTVICEVSDLFAKRSQVFSIPINRSIYPGPTDFVLAKPNFTTDIEPYALCGIPYRIGLTADAARVCISKLRSQTTFPQPVFSLQESAWVQDVVDSSIHLAVKAGFSDVFTLHKPGIYRVSLKESDLGGMFIEVREKAGYYPLRPIEMAEGMRYITSDDEFTKLIGSSDIKTAIDSFWIATAGNPQRAMTLIKNYFSRVDESRTLFTGSQPGYQTDRGMVYIVWGKPSFVYRNSDTETWIYGEGTENQVLKFDFNTIQMANGLLDYRLNRSIIYREAWFTAVESLRR